MVLAYLNAIHSPTAQDLYHVHVNLVRKCLQEAQDAAIEPDRHILGGTSEVNAAVNLAVYLSGTLCAATYPGSFLFQEIKSRTFLACLSLLHYYRVTALLPEHWGKLSRADFQQISFQARPDRTLWEKVRYAPNPYLSQLALLSLSYIQNGSSKLPLVIGPIAKIFFGSVSLVGLARQRGSQ